MATTTLTTLTQQVAAHMDVATTDLTAAVVKELACDALRWLVPLAPAGALASYGQPATGDGITGVTVSNALKILSVSTLHGGIHRYVDPEQFESIRSGFGAGANSFGPGRGVWTSQGSIGDIEGTIYTFRETYGVTVTYVPDNTFPMGSLTHPVGWSGLIALYIAMMLKLADEEYEGYAALKAQLEAQMSRFKFFSNTAPTVEG